MYCEIVHVGHDVSLVDGEEIDKIRAPLADTTTQP
jgi:hypothetical protein